MNRMQKLMLVGAMCASSLLVGCSAQKPEDVVIDYIGHIQRREVSVSYVKGICTEKRFPDLMKEANFLSLYNEVSYTIKAIDLRGDVACVGVSFRCDNSDKKTFDVPYFLVKESSGWKLATESECSPNRSRPQSDKMATDLEMVGRKLVVAMTQASTERWGAGLASVWPKNQKQLSADKDDICGIEFKSSTEYFKVLLDMDNYGKSNWAPYVSDIKPADIFDEKTGKAKWIVVKGITDETSLSVPVLVSANVEVGSLLTKKGSYSREQLTGELKFAGPYAVIVRAGGSGFVVEPRYSKHRVVYLSDCEIADDIEYLTP